MKTFTVYNLAKVVGTVSVRDGALDASRPEASAYVKTRLGNDPATEDALDALAADGNQSYWRIVETNNTPVRSGASKIGAALRKRA